MGKRKAKQEGPSKIDLFLREAAARGMNYAQAQIEETCRLQREEKERQERLRRRAQEKEEKNREGQPPLF